LTAIASKVGGTTAKAKANTTPTAVVERMVDVIDLKVA
jgi:hypothetical protein